MQRCWVFLFLFSSDKEKQHDAINKLIALLGDSDAEKASCLCHQGMFFVIVTCLSKLDI